MVYNSVSLKSAVGRLIRRTRLQDSSYIPDIHEWMAEAMELLQTSMELSPIHGDVKVSFHKGKFPCGMVELDAVEYCGTRLRYNNTVRDPRAGWLPPKGSGDAVFVSGVTRESTPSGNYLFTSTTEKIEQLKWNATEWYKVDRGCILTSFADGEVTLHGKQVPVDENGLPLIPDNGDYKEALYYFARAQLIASGWRDPVHRFDELMERFELHAGRAKEDITYPSVDKMQATADVWASLMPVSGYYESMFTSTGPETNHGI